MSLAAPMALVITVEPMGASAYGGYEIRLSGHLVGYRSYDGSASHEVHQEILASLAALLRERLGYPLSNPDGS